MLTTPLIKNENRHPSCENAADSFFVHRIMTNENFPNGNVYCGSVLPVLLLLSQELKDKFIEPSTNEYV